MSIFDSLSRLFSSRANAAARSSPTAASRASQDAEHGPVEDWFVRTARFVLGPLRSGAGGRGRQVSPLQQQLATLESENATLRADMQRLADEVVALRTLLYVHRRPPLS